MKTNEFRKELIRKMPGYKWTIHQNGPFHTVPGYFSATGIQSSGFNRLSTLMVTRRVKGMDIEYEVKSSGYGKSAPWLSEYTDGTLARALRGLQNHYEAIASNYSGHERSLEYARRENVE